MQDALPFPPTLAPNEDDDEAIDALGMTALGDIKLPICPGEHDLILSLMQYVVYDWISGSQELSKNFGFTHLLRC